MRDLEDPCEHCGVEEGEYVLRMPEGDIFVCEQCGRRLRKLRKKINHGDPPIG